MIALSSEDRQVIDELYRLASIAPIPVARAVVRHMIGGMLRAQGHAPHAASLERALDEQPEDAPALLRAVASELGPRLEWPLALSSAATCLDAASVGYAIHGAGGPFEMAIGRSLAGGAPPESLRRTRDHLIARGGSTHRAR